jgi:RimJ/RimL family protein N-acetyltransferase
MIKLEAFTPADFDRFTSWIDTPEILMTIAGPMLTYPLTHDQLQKYLDDKKSVKFNVVDTEEGKVIGHAEIITMGDGLYKLDKVIIGDRAIRGKGIGVQLMKALLEYSFEVLGAEIVELNVFDWNIAGIKCYEKAGFVFNPSKQMNFQMGNENWVALNMTYDKEKWFDQKDIVIRKATIGDIPILLQFEQGIIDAERPFIPRMKQGEIRYYDLESLLNAANAYVIVAELKGQVIACGYARIQPAEDHLDHQQHALLRFMYTDPAHRGQGVNGLVMENLMNWASAQGITEAVLDVYYDNLSAIRAYEKMGFSKYLITMRKAISDNPGGFKALS